MTETFFNNFLFNCKTEHPNLLQIKSTKLAEDFVSICNNFTGASIHGFIHNSGSPEGSFRKYNNDIIIYLYAKVFLPGLRYGETYSYEIKMYCDDVSMFSYSPSPIGESTEICLDKLIIKNDECIFSCFSKNDDTKELVLICKNIYIDNFIKPSETTTDYQYEPLQTRKASKEESICSYIDSGFSKSEMVEQLCADYEISEEAARKIIRNYFNNY